ncbi:uncharacterized protein PITG_22634, partial [Phytophthora infestans T30-4]
HQQAPVPGGKSLEPAVATKSVRWSTVTVYEFGVGIGGSAVPRRGGPAVGLARTPQCVWRTSVNAAQHQRENTGGGQAGNRRTTSAETRALVQAAGAHHDAGEGRLQRGANFPLNAHGVVQHRPVATALSACRVCGLSCILHVSTTTE